MSIIVEKSASSMWLARRLLAVHRPTSNSLADPRGTETYSF